MKGGEVLFLGIEGLALAKSEASILQRVRPAGIVLVSRNIGDQVELQSLVARLRSILPGVILCLDAEGGRVDRLSRIVGPSPAAAELALQPPAAAGGSGRRIGESLAAFGFDLDFAPVVDLDHGRSGNALDKRTFGGNPRTVISRARAFIRGLHAAGIGSCLKHFPGLGDAPADTHLSGARIELSPQALERELTPFTALFAEVPSIMVSHATYPGWDEPDLPASLSRKVSHDLLRQRLGFRGVLFSDDLEMGALAGHGDSPRLAQMALAAGCDGLLFCRRLDEAPAIARALARPRLDRRRAEAAKRLARLRPRAN